MDTSSYNEHRRRVRDVASTIDNKPPQTFLHLHLKLKKLQLEEDRLAIVERDNKILLGNLSSIMRTPGRVDHINKYECKSLNIGRRQQEQAHMLKENESTLRRILKREPQYHRADWQKHWESSLKYKKNISASLPQLWTQPMNGRRSQTSRGSISRESGRISQLSIRSETGNKRGKGRHDKKTKQVVERETEQTPAGEKETEQASVERKATPDPTN